REVTRPVLLRPPLRCFDSTSDFSGFCLVISARDTTVWKRRVGVVGLYVLIGMLVRPRLWRRHSCLPRRDSSRRLLRGRPRHVKVISKSAHETKSPRSQ